jgi:hypothetical protein
MRPHQPFDDEQMLGRQLAGDPQVLAFLWIEAYAENLTDRVRSYHDGDDEQWGNEPITVDDLIRAALHDNYITRGGTFEGEGTDPVFWEKLAILKDIEIPKDRRNSFFSCSC